MGPTVTLGLAGCLRGNLGITEKVNGTFLYINQKQGKTQRKEREKTDSTV